VTLVLDAKSLLAQVDGAMTLAAVERELAKWAMTLDVEGAERSEETVALWLAGGARGARDAWLDPADHLVAGLELRLMDGRTVVVRPAPRRAVGPDLMALFVGMGERFGRVERAWLRVHPKGVKRPSVGRLAVEADPAVSEEEARLLEAMAISVGPSPPRAG
jgi:alkyldihydroxyacetonephosphate synthase